MGGALVLLLYHEHGGTGTGSYCCVYVFGAWITVLLSVFINGFVGSGDVFSFLMD